VVANDIAASQHKKRPICLRTPSQWSEYASPPARGKFLRRSA